MGRPFPCQCWTCCVALIVFFSNYSYPLHFSHPGLSLLSPAPQKCTCSDPVPTPVKVGLLESLAELPGTALAVVASENTNQQHTTSQ